MEPEEEDYLMNRSVKHDIDSISRTYLLIENDVGGPSVKGYFTLAVKCLSIKENKDIQDEIKNRMNIDRGTAQAYLLGQLAKADGAEKGLGKEMMELAIKIFKEGHNMFGCRVIRLDCKDGLLKYYEKNGFTPIGKSKDGTLNQMIMVL